MSYLFKVANNRLSRRVDPRAHLMLKLTYLPAFITIVFRGMPGVWKSQHRLLLCWLIMMQAVYPGRKMLQELARWSPQAVIEWRLRHLLKASYWSIHIIVEWLAQDVMAQLPPPDDGIIYVIGDGSHKPKRAKHNALPRKAAIPSIKTGSLAVVSPCSSLPGLSIVSPWPFASSCRNHIRAIVRRSLPLPPFPRQCRWTGEKASPNIR